MIHSRDIRRDSLRTTKSVLESLNHILTSESSDQKQPAAAQQQPQTPKKSHSNALGTSLRSKPSFFSIGLAFTAYSFT